MTCIRLPEKVHDDLVAYADSLNQPMNTVITTILRDGLKRTPGEHRDRKAQVGQRP